jgi:uncharacterized membrane protein
MLPNRLALALFAAAVLACSGRDGAVTGPSAAARSTDPTVTATVPAASVRDTTLDVRVLGSGYDPGTQAAFLLGGLPDPKVRTNATRYVSAKELVANITIDADAVPAFRDVAVTTSSGKKGIGTEKFAVLAVNDVGTLGGSQAIAYDVNADGVVAGKSLTPTESGWFAFVWSSAAGIRQLPTISGSTGSYAQAISDPGLIVGTDEGLAAVWTPDGAGGYTEQRLGTFGGASSYGRGVNVHGVVIGEAYEGGGAISPTPFRWTSALGLQRLGLAVGYATGVNAGSTIVGYSGSDAFVWTATGGARLLPRCAGAFTAQARAVNDGEVIVGGCGHRKGGATLFEAVRWRPGSSPDTWLAPEAISTRTPCPGCGMARGINNAGEIVGENEGRAFRWRAGAGLVYLDALLINGDGVAFAVTDPSGGGTVRIAGVSSANGAASRPRAVWWP